MQKTPIAFDQTAVGLPIDADCARRSERRNFLFNISSASSASLWFIAKAMFHQ